MSQTPSRTLLSGHTHLDIRAIERELMQLWKSAGEQTDGERAMVTRTCVLNLLVLSPHGYDATPVIARLTDTMPSRALVITIEPEQPPAGEPVLDAWVQAHCQLPAPGRPQVCCEQITIVARGVGAQRLPGTILPLLVPDVPVAIWYPRGVPFDDALSERLLTLADRVIVDTATVSAPEQSLQRIARLDEGEAALADLTWGRLTIWREQLAQCFDAPALMTRLSECERVTIVASRAAGRVPALMVGGWLASRLGWRLRDQPTSAEFRMLREGGEVVIELREAERDLPELVPLEALTLVCNGVTVSVALSGEWQLVTTTTVPGRPTLRRSVRLPQPEIADLLADELRQPVSDTTFVSALRVAATLLAGTPAS